MLLHGGLANSDYWGHQVTALAPRHTVILMDSRGHGRSTRDARPYGYDLMADDVVALLDTLHIAKADVVGWSDGAILGLDLAIRHPDRVGKVFAFAANTVTSGVQEGVEKNPTFARYIERAGREYARLSATPKDYDAFVAQISKMWETEPNWTDAQLKSIQLAGAGGGWRPRRGDQAGAHRIHRRDHPGRRAADPAEHQPFRVPAGPRAVQRGAAEFFGGPVVPGSDGSSQIGGKAYRPAPIRPM